MQLAGSNGFSLLPAARGLGRTSSPLVSSRAIESCLAGAAGLRAAPTSLHETHASRLLRLDLNSAAAAAQPAKPTAAEQHTQPQQPQPQQHHGVLLVSAPASARPVEAMQQTDNSKTHAALSDYSGNSSSSSSTGQQSHKMQSHDPVAAAQLQQQQQQQQEPLKPGAPAATPLTRRLRKQCVELLAAGDTERADGLLWGAVMRLSSPQQLQGGLDVLKQAGLLRPAVLAAMLVQLGKLGQRQQRQQQAAAQQQRREAKTAAAVERNRKKQLQRKQLEQQWQQQQQQWQQQQQQQQQQQRGVDAQSMQQHGWQHSHIHSHSQAIGNNGHVQQQQQQQQVVLAQGAPENASSTSSTSSMRLTHRFQQYLLQRIVQQVKSVPAADFSTSQLSLLLHWLAKMQVQDEQLLQALAAAAGQRLTSGETKHLVPVLWGLARSAAAGQDTAGTQQQQQQQRLQAQRRQQQQQVLLLQVQRQQQQQQQQEDAPLPQQQHLNAAVPPDAEFVSQWLDESAANLATFSPSDLAASIYSLALLGRRPPQPWVDAFFTASAAALPKCSAHDLSNMLWAMATLQLQPPAASAKAKATAKATAAAAAAARQAPAGQAPAAAADGPALAAGSSSSHSPWWGLFQAAVAGELWHFTGVGIANLLWAAAKLRLQPTPQLAELLLWQGQRTFCQMDLQLLVSMAWGVAELQLQPRRFWLHRLCNRVAVLQGSSSLTPGLAASLLLSLGGLRHCPRVWMGRFLAALQPQLTSFSPQDFANAFTAFARMLYSPPQEWMFDFTMEARLALPRCNGAALLSILHAQAVLSTNTSFRVNPDFLAAVLARCRALAGSFSTADCANLAQSVVHLKVAPGVGLLAALAGRFSALASTGAASCHEVAVMTWALGAFWHSSAECMWLRQQPALLGQLVQLSGQCLGSGSGSYGPMELRRLIVALASMGCNPGPAWLAAHEAAVVSQLDSLYASSLEHVLRGYRELSYVPQQLQLLQAALRQKQLAEQAQQQQRQHQQQQRADKSQQAHTDGAVSSAV